MLETVVGTVKTSVAVMLLNGGISLPSGAKLAGAVLAETARIWIIACTI